LLESYNSIRKHYQRDKEKVFASIIVKLFRMHATVIRYGLHY